MRPRIVRWIAMVAAAGLLYASSLMVPQINEGRKTLNMIGSGNPLENAPPDFAFAVQAFGAFRSLMVNLAFNRAEEYKRLGRYYDAMELARWICRLQPRLPAVWQFQAWNMAWNISVTTFTPEERWNWVYNGARLLRDEGLPHNRRAINIYKDLAWIYVNKMAKPVDDFHFDYKRYWAWRMHLVLGPPPSAYGYFGGFKPGHEIQRVMKRMDMTQLFEAAKQEAERRGGGGPYDPTSAPTTAERSDSEGPTQYEVTLKAAVDRLREIDDAPDTLDELYAKFPETRDMVAKLREIGAKIESKELNEDEYYAEGGLAWTFFLRYRQLADPPVLVVALRKTKNKDEEGLKRFDQIMGITAQKPAGLALVHFMQNKVLHEVYKLEPKEMTELSQVFGPMDWRTVDSSSLYWINKGLVAGNETITSFRNDKLNTTRLLFFSLNQLKNYNHIVFEPIPDDISRSYIDFSPDLNFIEPMHRAFLLYGPNFDNEQDPTKRVGASENYRTGHMSFLTQSIRDLYFAGRIREAQKYYTFLQTTYGKDDSGRPRESLLYSLQDFVENSIKEMMDSQETARGVIFAFCDKAFDELLRGELPAFAAALANAKHMHDVYTESRVDKVTESRKLPPLDEMIADRLVAIYRSLPPTTDAQTAIRATLWERLPYWLQYPVYDELLPMFREECELWKFDLAQAYPEPEGMAEYRKTHPGRAKEARPDNIETPVQVRE